jgi:hypothetical protein
MCFPVLCGDAMTKQNSKAGGGDNAEYYNNIRSAKSSSGTVLLFAMFVYPRLSGEALFLHTTYSRFVPHNAALLPAAEASGSGSP